MSGDPQTSRCLTIQRAAVGALLLVMAGVTAWHLVIAPHSLLIRNGVLTGKISPDETWQNVDALAPALTQRLNTLVTVQSIGNGDSRNRIIWTCRRFRYDIYPFRLLAGPSDDCLFDNSFTPSQQWLQENAIGSILFARGDDAGNVQWRCLPLNGNAR